VPSQSPRQEPPIHTPYQKVCHRSVAQNGAPFKTFQCFSPGLTDPCDWDAIPMKLYRDTSVCKCSNAIRLVVRHIWVVLHACPETPQCARIDDKEFLEEPIELIIHACKQFMWQQHSLQRNTITFCQCEHLQWHLAKVCSAYHHITKDSDKIFVGILRL